MAGMNAPRLSGTLSKWARTPLVKDAHLRHDVKLSDMQSFARARNYGIPVQPSRSSKEAKMSSVFGMFYDADWAFSADANASVGHRIDINRNFSKTKDPDNIQADFYKTPAGLACIIVKRMGSMPRGGFFIIMHRMWARGQHRWRMQIYSKMTEAFETSVSSIQAAHVQSRTQRMYASSPDDDRLTAIALGHLASTRTAESDTAHDAGSALASTVPQQPDPEPNPVCTTLDRHDPAHAGLNEMDRVCCGRRGGTCVLSKCWMTPDKPADVRADVPADMVQPLPQPAG